MSDALPLTEIVRGTLAAADELTGMARALWLSDDGRPATPAQVAALDALRQAIQMMEAEA